MISLTEDGGPLDRGITPTDDSSRPVAAENSCGAAPAGTAWQEAGGTDFQAGESNFEAPDRQPGAARIGSARHLEVHL